ncbi:CIA30 family protein [Hyphobacterium sp. CCMP332]|nr:CIA30 family protein [Hyphobacterium sp. CCMP332]
MQALTILILIIDFNLNTDLSKWNIVNDVVMGGQSRSQIELTEDGHARFSGHVSLENNGGFASVRYRFDPLSIEGKKFVKILCKGDGSKFQFRLKRSSNEEHSYKSEFKTSSKWETIKIRLNSMEPTYRGRKPDLPNYEADNLEEISILIANAKEQDFEILIDKIWIE